MKFKNYHQTDLSDKSFLVTGGAGFIGSNIVSYLLQHGAKKVRVLDNFATGSLKNIEEFRDNSSFELIEGDIRDLETCKKAVEGIEYISHQAALGSVPRSINDPITSNATNITGFLNMLVAARDEGIKHFVYAASSSTYGDHKALPKVEPEIGNPLSPYAVTKYVNELYAAVFSMTYDFHSIGFRYFNVFGPHQNPQGPYAAVIPIFIEHGLTNKSPFINGDGETSRDFTFIANAVQANIKGMLTEVDKAEVINIAYGQRTTLLELWNRIAELTDCDKDPVHRDFRKGDVKHSLADVTKAQENIGYNPDFSVMDGLKITVDWYRDNPGFFEE